MTDQTDQTDQTDAAATATQDERDRAAAAYTDGMPDAAGDAGPARDPDDQPEPGGGAEIVDDPEARAAADGRTPGQLLVALEEAEHAAAERLDQAQRALAELKNVKRRTAEESRRAGAAGAGRLLVQMLDAIDDLDRTAIVADGVEDDAAGVAGGVRAVHQKLHEALRGAGVERIDVVDVPFDATRHDAVQQVPADGSIDQPEVAEVFRPGYVIDGRVLRPAMVVVRQ